MNNSWIWNQTVKMYMPVVKRSTTNYGL